MADVGWTISEQNESFNGLFIDNWVIIQWIGLSLRDNLQ